MWYYERRDGKATNHFTAVDSKGKGAVHHGATHHIFEVDVPSSPCSWAYTPRML